jgi:hypothetical protein
MATISSISTEELRLARKGGFKNKKPKKPNGKASLSTLQNWVTRYNQWVKDAKKRASEYKTAQKLKDSIRNHR